MFFSLSTAECDLQGGKTILYSVICIVAVIISLLYLTPVFYYIPKSTLAAVIIAAVYRLVDIKKMKVYYRTNIMDFTVAVVTFIGTPCGCGCGCGCGFTRATSGKSGRMRANAVTRTRYPLPALLWSRRPRPRPRLNPSS